MIKKHEGRVYELLSPDVQGAIEMLWVELQPGVWTEDEPVIHGGEECLVVLSGHLEAHVGKTNMFWRPETLSMFRVKSRTRTTMHTMDARH